MCEAVLTQIESATPSQVNQHTIWKSARKRLDRNSGVSRKSLAPRRCAPPDNKIVVDAFDLLNGASLKPVHGLAAPDTTVVQRIKIAVCAVAGINQTTLMARRRHPEIVVPRHIAMALCKKFTTMSLPQIGRQFKRDHTAILWAVDKIEPLIARIESRAISPLSIEEMASALIAEATSVRFVVVNRARRIFDIVDIAEEG